MTRLAAITLMVAGCKTPAVVATCNPAGVGVVEMEIPIPCAEIERNVQLALGILAERDLLQPAERSWLNETFITVVDADCVGWPCDASGVTTSATQVYVTRDRASLLHELLHVVQIRRGEQLATFAHYGWRELGFEDADRAYAVRLRQRVRHDD